MRSEAIITIAGMAVVMLLVRWSGFWLVGRLAPSPKVTQIIEQLGGVTLVALTAPAVVAAGPPGVVAAVVVALVARRVGNLLVALLVGMLVIGVLRRVLG